MTERPGADEQRSHALFPPPVRPPYAARPRPLPAAPIRPAIPAGPAPGHEPTPPEPERPFWFPSEDHDRPRLPRPRRPARQRTARPRKSRHADRGPAAGLTALVLLSLVCAFFCWVSAEPFWLATGHAVRGTVVLDGCDGSGLGRRCTGVFTAADTTFGAAVRVSGITDAVPGATLAARMRDAGATTAYVETGPVPRHLRWAAGLVMALLAGLAAVAATGAGRLPRRRERWLTVAAGCAAPLLLFTGFLAATF